MSVEQNESLVNHHWNYFLALESDMERVTRFVEFTEKNYKVYSIELAHLLFAASSEFEIVAKLLCGLREPKTRIRTRGTIKHLGEIITTYFPNIVNENIYVKRYGLILHTPLEFFGAGTSPKWWESYHKVKHHRKEKFEDANLENALLALASLQIVILYYQKEKSTPQVPNEAIKKLKPNSTLLKFNEHYYIDLIEKEGGW